MKAELIAVVTTVETREDAQHMANKAVASGLAACAQLEAIASIYSWKGKIENTQEIRITFKTTRERWQALKAQIVASHPYEIPAVYTLEVAEATESYGEWVRQNTQQQIP